MIRIALFSDIHGKILLPFKMVDRYQSEFNKKIDFIIQCGDIGAYPNTENLDKATIKHAKYDRDELGFHDDFTVFHPEIEHLLKKLDVKMICVRGNHEDHDFLDELEEKYPEDSLFPIDIYQHVWVCKSGEIQRFQKNEDSVTYVGLGRVGDRKNRQEKKFIQKYEFDKMKKHYKSKEVIDLFITHDSDDSSEPGYGSKEIREAMDQIPFQFHFFGHTGKPFSQHLASNGITQTIKIKELEFTDSGVLPENCMLILEKDGGEFNLERMPLSFTNVFTKHNWKY